MPSSFLLHLQPINQQNFDVDLGSHVHGLLFNLLRLADPVLAESIHDQLEKKPFTVSTLLNLIGRPVRDLAPGQDCLIRVTTLDDALSEALNGYFLRHALEEVRLGNVRAEIRGVYLVGSAIPTGRQDVPSPLTVLCRRESYEDLLSTPPVNLIRLTFRSPTALRQAGRNLPLPDPRGLFTGFLHRWNSFAPRGMDKEYLSSALERGAIVISYHRIHTEAFRLPDSLQIGFVGEANFRILDPGIRPMASILARFAYYSGSGYKTAQGMGQTIPSAGGEGEEI